MVPRWRELLTSEIDFGGFYTVPEFEIGVLGEDFRRHLSRIFPRIVRNMDIHHRIVKLLNHRIVKARNHNVDVPEISIIDKFAT